MTSQTTAADPPPAALPSVRLEVRHAGGGTADYTLAQVDFLIGSVAGCDLRLPGADLPAVICLLARHPSGVQLRKLAQMPGLLHNGGPAVSGAIADGDRLSIGGTDVVVRVQAVAGPDAVAQGLAQVAHARQDLQAKIARFREQVLRFEQDRARAVRATPDLPERETLEQQLAAARAELHSQEAEHSQLAEEQARLAEREKALEAEQAELDAARAVYQSDLVRLDRRQGECEQREARAAQLQVELDQRRDALQQQASFLEEQVAQLDDWRAKLTSDTEALTGAQKEHESRRLDLDRRLAAQEGQQAMLTSLRNRLERKIEEHRVESQELAEQRERQEAREAELAAREDAVERRGRELEEVQKSQDEARAQWAQRSVMLEAALARLKQAQAKMEADHAELTQRQRAQQELDERTAEAQRVLQAQQTEVEQAQRRLDAERATLRDQMALWTQGNQTRVALQEQLVQRSEELSAQQRQLREQQQAFEAQAAALEQKQAEIARREQESIEQMASLRLELEDRERQIEQQRVDMAAAESGHQQALVALEQQRRELADRRAAFESEQHLLLDKLAHSRADYDGLKQEAGELLRQLPELELRVQASLERVAQAREQLRHHLAEIHRYVSQSQDDLEAWRGRLQDDVKSLQQQELDVRRKQDEQRHLLVSFRQQAIEWQGRIAELRTLLTAHEARLELKHAEVEQQTRDMDATSVQLARREEELHEQQREVADRRQEVDRHLVDMRAWYQQKLRDLAGVALDAVPVHPPAPPPADDDEALVPTQRSILSMTGPLDLGDRQLGDILRNLQLIDADTLTALLVEARRQRCSLRQVLFKGGVLTLYQLALIEAGNLQGLMLGPLRVIDRLRVARRETLYRVFDPRRGTEALLRHLSEDEMLDAVHPDEFRQRFSQAILHEPHLVGTLEVLEIQGRPAVLQERVEALAATDWPALASAPGVCFRLLTQAARGLAAAHHAGLTHGHLADPHFLLTNDGILKIAGVGEPLWLTEHADEEQDDLKALGRIVSGWCTPAGVRRGPKAKPIPEALVSILFRLAAEGTDAYRNIDELLADLERVSGDIPPNAEAWDRLLKYTRDHVADDVAERLSA